MENARKCKRQYRDQFKAMRIAWRATQRGNHQDTRRLKKDAYQQFKETHWKEGDWDKHQTGKTRSRAAYRVKKKQINQKENEHKVAKKKAEPAINIL